MDEKINKAISATKSLKGLNPINLEFFFSRKIIILKFRTGKYKKIAEKTAVYVSTYFMTQMFMKI
jgi:hypothetical protein